MDHFECLKALVDLGASEEVVDWTAAFLYQRKMSVKVREARSVPRTVLGGSPQGSILGGFLFCCTTNCFAALDSPELPREDDGSSTGSSTDSTNSLSRDSDSIERTVTRELGVERILEREVDIYEGIVSSTPTTRGQFVDFRPPRELLDLSSDLASDEDEPFQFLRARPFNPLDSTIAGDGSGTEEGINIVNSACPDPIKSYVYVDDFNTVEKLRLSDAARHLTTDKQRIRVRALKSELQFARAAELAADIGMRVNNKKTQVLCIHSDKSSQITSYINAEDGAIESGNELKILGFYFSSEPNAIKHAMVTIEKFYRVRS